MFRFIAVLCVQMVLAAVASAQTYPVKPIRLIVPFPPGGTNDVVGRVIAERLGESLKQTVLVDNRGGAGGMVGTDAVAKAPADGYTVLVSNSGALAINPSLYPKISYNVIDDFAPISLVADVTIVLVVHPSVTARSVKELIELGKRKQGLNAALPSVGSMHHLLTEIFKATTKTNLVLIPYKGSGPAVIDLIAGNVDMDFDNLPAVLQFIRAGRLRALAVASPKRSELLPDVPTMDQAGVSGMVATPWFAMMAPAATPKAIVARLNTEVVKIMQTAEVKKYLASQGANPLWATPEETGAFIKNEYTRWAKVVKETGAKPE